MSTLIAVVVGISIAFSTTNAANADPGTVGDPIVTKSYVDERIEELLDKFQKSNSSDSSANDSPNDTSDQSNLDLIELHNYINTYVDIKYNELLKKTSTTANPSTQTQTLKEKTELHDYINAYIDSRLEEFNKTETKTSDKYVVIELDEGMRVIGGESTEFILRGGNATAVGNADGDGLTDITSGVDLKTGDSVAYNHLLIVPRPDGRGLDSHGKSWIMVKGSYEIIHMGSN